MKPKQPVLRTRDMVEAFAAGIEAERSRCLQIVEQALRPLKLTKASDPKRGLAEAPIQAALIYIRDCIQKEVTGDGE